MGLDIYLYRSDDIEAVKKAYSSDEEVAVPEERIEAGLSQTDPEHICRPDYLRSSYNEGGYNSVAERRGWPTYYDLFQPEGDGYIVTPDWAAVKQRVTEALETVTVPEYDTVGLRPNMFHEPTVRTAHEALTLFMKIRDEQQKDNGFRSFNSKEGDFFLDGVQVFGFVHAKQTHPYDVSLYVIVKAAESDEPDFYLNALKIVGEMCDYVLAQTDPQTYFLHWSG